MLLLALSILFNVAGQLLMKRAALDGGSESGGGMRALFSPYFFGGAICLGCALLAWVQVLRKIPLTLAHPISGVVFLVVPFASHLIWREPLSTLRVLGMMVIVFGVVLVARG